MREPFIYLTCQHFTFAWHVSFARVCSYISVKSSIPFCSPRKFTHLHKSTTYLISCPSLDPSWRNPLGPTFRWMKMFAAVFMAGPLVDFARHVSHWSRCIETVFLIVIGFSRLGFHGPPPQNYCSRVSGRLYFVIKRQRHERKTSSIHTLPVSHSQLIYTCRLITKT